MASRESQGLQIALILFVMVSVVLAVTTFVFYRSAEEAKKTAADERQKKKTADDQYAVENFKVQYLMHILGADTLAEAELQVVQASLEADEQMAAINQAYEQDMITYGEGLPQERMNYRDLPGHLIMALRNKNVANTNLSNEYNRVSAEKSNIEQAEQNRTQTAQQEMQKAKDELAGERATFKQQFDRINTEKQQLADDFTKSRGQLEAQLAMAARKDAASQTQITQLESTVSQQKDRIVELIDEPFEVADGRVTWVNQSSRTVWINLGLADGLRRQTTFSVYDVEAMNVAPSRAEGSEEEGGAVRKADEAKGKLEVTRVIDQHLAEARIVEDDPANPILPGDQVFSPAWKPGRRIRFALVGFMDINNDRRSDRDTVRNIITAGGGVIDAEVHDDGAVEGQLTPSTRYLVRGGEPQTLTDTKVRNAYTGILREAEQLGIQEISVLILLDLMGYRAEVRTVPLGEGASAAQLKAGAAPGKAAGSGGEANGFRERTPPSSTNGSAF